MSYWLAEAASAAGVGAKASLLLVGEPARAALYFKELPPLAEARAWLPDPSEELWIGGFVEEPGSARLWLRRARFGDHEWSLWLEQRALTIGAAWAALVADLSAALGWAERPWVPASDRALLSLARHIDATRLAGLLKMTHAQDSWRHLLDYVCAAEDAPREAELSQLLRVGVASPDAAPAALAALEEWCVRRPDRSRPWTLALELARARGDEEAQLRCLSHLGSRPDSEFGSDSDLQV